MPFDVITYFEVFVAGFVTVYTFRAFTGQKEKLAEFEWVGFSAIWGLILIITNNSIPGNVPQMAQLLQKPFQTAIIMSIFGIIFGFIGSRISISRTWKFIRSHSGINGIRIFTFKNRK